MIITGRVCIKDKKDDVVHSKGFNNIQELKQTRIELTKYHAEHLAQGIYFLSVIIDVRDN